MNDRRACPRQGMTSLILGAVLGGMGATLLIGGAAFAWGWHAGATAAHAAAPAIRVLPVAQDVNPREFIPIPPRPGQDPAQAPFPGSGAQQNCDRILFFYQGRLYQLRPGPTPRGGNPEFFFMQPYEGPQIPGFPEQTPGAPGMPSIPGLPQAPPTFRF